MSERKLKNFTIAEVIEYVKTIDNYIIQNFRLPLIEFIKKEEVDGETLLNLSEDDFKRIHATIDRIEEQIQFIQNMKNKEEKEFIQNK